MTEIYGTVRGRDGAPTPDPRRFDRHVTAKRRIADCRTHDHRCSACGERHALFERDRVLQFACEDHPGATGICWTWLLQAAAIRAVQSEALGDSFAAQLAELDQMAADNDVAVGERRYNALLVVLPLLIEWGGLPERRPSAEIVGPRPSLY